MGCGRCIDDPGPYDPSVEFEDDPEPYDEDGVIAVALQRLS